jgi:ribose transport system permease protein
MTGLPAAAAPPTSSFGWWRLLKALGPFLALAVLWAAFAVAVWLRADPSDPLGNPWAFVAWKNQCLILAQSAIISISACGIVMIMVAGGIDLSLGSIIALSGVSGAMTLAAGWGPVAATTAALITGATVGALNGALVAGTGITPFIITLGTLGVARGAAKGLADQQTINVPPS